MAKSPDAFRTISEVSSRLDTPAHVLRPKTYYCWPALRHCFTNKE